MGCGASTKVSEDYEGGQQDASPLKSVVAGTGEAMKTAGIGIALAAGAGLLNAAEAVPFIAPVAYLIGSIVVACQDAQSLKSDAREFAILVQELERILLKCKDLRDQEKTINAIYEVLDEAMAFVRTLRQTNIFVQVMASKHNIQTLENCRDRLMLLLQSLQLSISLENTMITKLKFQEERKLNTLITDMGGADMIIENPAQLKIVQEAMSDEGKMLIALQHAHIEESKSIKKSIISNHNVVLDALQKQLDDQRVRSETSKRQTQILTMQNELLMKQVEQMNAMALQNQMIMTDFMSRFPLAHNEANRVLTIEEMGLKEICLGKCAELEDYAEEFLLKCKKLGEPKNLQMTMTMVNIIDTDTQHNICVRGFHPTDKDIVGRGSNNKFNIARKTSACQYVVGSGQVQCFRTDIDDGSRENYPCIGANSTSWMTDEIMQTLTTNDSAVLENVNVANSPIMQIFMSWATGASSQENARARAVDIGVPLLEYRILEMMMSYAGSLKANPEGAVYIGAPIIIQEVVVGTLCTFVIGNEASKATSSDELKSIFDMKASSEKVAGILHRYASSPIHQQYIKDKRNGLLITSPTPSPIVKANKKVAPAE